VKKSHLSSTPDENGFFGKYGGAFIPPQLEKPFKEISDAYEHLSKSYDFRHELKEIRKHSDSILVNLSGRGDKDIDFVVENHPIPPKP